MPSFLFTYYNMIFYFFILQYYIFSFLFLWKHKLKFYPIIICIFRFFNQFESSNKTKPKQNVFSYFGQPYYNNIYILKN